MKRQRGRNNGGKPHMPMRAQTFDSAGPDVRIRGNAYQVFEKYLALARDATAAGDRVAAENFYQHAEHYYRMINANYEGQQRQHPGHGQGGQPQPQGGHDPRGGQQPPHPGGGQPAHQQPYVEMRAQTAPADPGAGPQPLVGPAGGTGYGGPSSDGQPG